MQNQLFSIIQKKKKLRVVVLIHSTAINWQQTKKGDVTNAEKVMHQRSVLTSSKEFTRNQVNSGVEIALQANVNEEELLNKHGSDEAEGENSKV